MRSCERYQLHHGDCLDAMRAMEPESIHTIITDPPYGLSFMGKDWDGCVPGVAFWLEALRVAKPGAHLLAFGGTRTFHRLTVAIEDAGWEIRDCLSWLYGSGFPKSHNLRGEREGWGTALKPSWEPIIMARKPLRGTVAANVEAFGTGALNIDGCRIATKDVLSGSGTPPLAFKGQNARPFHESAIAQGVNQHAAGRWPANVLLDEEAAEALDAQSGELHAGSHPARRAGMGFHGGAAGTHGEMVRMDSGGASRFFYVAKPDRAERNSGLGGRSTPAVSEHATMGDAERADWKARNGNFHPTVKPVDLMRYLCRLVSPPGMTILDPFMGSGTTGVAAIMEGLKFVGCELNPEYAEIAAHRIGAAQPPLCFEEPSR
jgi:DNA modification methylase